LHVFWIAVLSGVTLFWIAAAIDLALGLPSIPALSDTQPRADSSCPAVSILFAARNEAEKLPHALDTLLSLDYPVYEVVAVDDRSEDGTGTILEERARRVAHLKPTRISSLPRGWLGKPHALQAAYERSNGDWLVFTDADVHFAQDLLRRAVALAEEKRWDHLTLLGSAKMFTLGEKIGMLFFGMGFIVSLRPWRVSEMSSSTYAGVGAFQMIRRSAYETIGTHRRLAMEVIDDMKLGKLAKEAGVRSGVAKAGQAVSVHWHAGVRNMIRGTTKNFFAASGFKLPVTLLQVCGILLMGVFPVMTSPFVHGWARWLVAISVGVPLIIEGAIAVEFGTSPLYAVTYPVGALLYAWMLTRSAVVTLWRGGIVWRGTFYPLDELKRGVV